MHIEINSREKMKIGKKKRVEEIYPPINIFMKTSFEHLQM